MMPSIELRLATMQRALREVILPAIDRDNPLAREQAQLLVAHLDLIGLQWRDAQACEAAAARAMTTLAARLLAEVTGGAQTDAALTALADVLARCETAGMVPTATRATLAAAIDTLVGAVYADGDAAARTGMADAILAHAAREARRDRAWFAANGMDPERASLPDLATLRADLGG
ncbi:MAG: hypothetical protein AB7Q81_09655 [Gammaproteobacteria bacterium]